MALGQPRDGIRAQLAKLLVTPGPSKDLLGGRAAYILSAWAFRSVPDIEFNAVTLTQIVESLAIHRTLVKKILLPGIVLDEPKSLIDS